MTHLKSNFLRRPGAWLIAGSLLALAALTGCFGTDGGGGGKKAYTCTGPNDSLCVERAALLDTGEVLYQGTCTGCHGASGHGSPGGTPPHANADFVQQNKRKTIEILLAGYSDSLLVNGLWYESGMPAFMDGLTNLEAAAILTYIRVALNDSTVGSCDSTNLDPDGFATCQKVARTPADLASDSVAVWEVKAVRDSILAAQ